MNPRSTKMLAIAAAVLLLGVFLLNTVEDDFAPPETGLLLPDLKPALNAIDTVTIDGGGNSVTIRRDGERWTVESRGGYPADTGKLREGLLALADASRLEAKTADPGRHAQLGLAGDDATRLAIGGGGLDVAVVLGNVAQRSYRYARLDGEDQTWLIDRNPELPSDPGDWLLTELVDIASEEIAEVTIAHAAGETLNVTRGAEAGAFTVGEVPEGRELRYAGIVNPIAGTLKGLELEDVRAAAEDDPAPDVTTVFRSDDGLAITVTRREIDGDAWFALSAEASAAAPADEAATDTADQADESAETGDGAPVDETADPATRAAEINATAAGWLFRLPAYKGEQIARGWEDLLKPLDEDGDGG